MSVSGTGLYKGLTIALLLAAIAGGAMLYRQNRKLDAQLTAMQSRMTMLAQQSRPGGSNGGRQEDPYIAGAVKNTILKNYSAVNAIYARYLKSKPEKANGKIKADWQIGPDGEVIRPEIIFSQLDPGGAMEKALLAEIATWNFPPPPGGIRRYVAHTFILREKPPTEEEREQARQSRVESMVQSRNVKKK